MWHHDVTNARTCQFSAVCLTAFPFEFRPRTFTIGFYGKNSIISELMILECSFPLNCHPKCKLHGLFSCVILWTMLLYVCTSEERHVLVDSCRCLSPYRCLNSLILTFFLPTFPCGNMILKVDFDRFLALHDCVKTFFF